MDEICKLQSFDKDKKLSSNPTKEEKVKRKLSAIHKKIGNLQYRRKLAQNQSVKAKRKIHNQINQIIKRLRAREQILLSNVDEVHASFDANISEELLKLQSVYSHSQALFQNLSVFSGNTGIISNITSTLANVNCKEKSDFKPLTFVSDFEEMKTRAETYGNLDGDFVKGGLVLNENNLNVSEDSVVKKKCVNEGTSASNINPGTSCCWLEKSSSEESDLDETFQIINLIDNMHCSDLEDYDFVMDEEEGAKNSQQLIKKLDEEVNERENKVAKICVKTEKSHKIDGKNINFNPDEEWKKLQELSKKMAEFNARTSKITERWSFNGEKLHVLQDANNLQFNKSSRNDVPTKDTKNINVAVNIVSPADLIQKSFQSYQVKGDIKYWLASN